ncbi:N-acetylmuramoyl-L-alanine amidase [Streptomyces sp. LX-29]|uniref:N-acetylmuramoyl-L-alanine amidase n=1 Tax=Streptomyces sp. LX-29 TaxID=2900152 RepID=UPI00240E95FC|nr:N-acetylmuramoyl-L-alanine amidase [Streptomyces sp. LX-29]WFB09819.1 N-acetylmuramoyl-L-alanine amidase [Streptomyces sp. LX-29]
MSHGSSPPTSGRRPRGTLLTLLALAALAPAALAGCAGDGDRDGRGGAAHSSGSGKGTGTGTGEPDGGPAPSASSPSRTNPSGSPDNNKDNRGSLKGKVIVIDPGHNPHNREHPSEIARLVDIGTKKKECDTTGTATNSGYPEASFTLDVARRARTLLEERGAKVEFTQDGDRRYGPCVDERARIGNRAGADAVVSVHADGAGAGQRGFHVIAPASVRGGAADTSAIVGPSRELAEAVIDRFTAATRTEPANYLGGGTGLTVRDDLGGLNLSTVPKVFIECGNMRDPEDAARLTDPKWRARAAQGIAEGITDFLRG